MLLFLLLLPCAFSAICPLYSQDASKFFQEAQVRDPASPAACPGFQTTCCTAAGLGDMQDGSNPLIDAFNNKVKSVSDSCLQDIRSLVCGVCSPDQDRIFTVYSFEIDMLLCPGFVDRIFAACADATVGTEKVSKKYPNGAEFLHDVLETAGHISVRQGENCYDPGVRPCTRSDYVGVYSDCVDGFRTAFFQKPIEVTCQGGVTLPDPVSALECDKACRSGTYLPVGERECVNCPAGEFSIGGGIRMETWKSWPHGITTTSYCEHRYTGLSLNNDLCKHWKLNDTELVSGGIGDNVNTILQLAFELVRPGHVSFEWKVEAESCPFQTCDGFYFEIDGVRMINFTSFASWTNSRFEIGSGSHVISFVFSKDYSTSRGDDSARIDSLEINGMNWADSACTKCPAGSFSTPGSRSCQLCKNNTASNELGTPGGCPACDASHYALVGSTSCTPREQCREIDYEILYSDCEFENGSFSRTKRPTWIEPHICMGGVSLPPAEYGLECADCPPGFRRLPQYGDCVGCPTGQKAVGNDCVSCPAGTYAHKVFAVDEWDTWPDWTHHVTLFPLSASLEHYCVGEGCLGDWRLMGSYIDSGIGHAFPATQVLNFTADVEALNAVFSYNISFDCDSSCMMNLKVVEVSSGEEVLTQYHYFSGSYDLEIPGTGFYSFIFTFDGFNSVLGSSSSSAGVGKIHSIRLSGARDGSAASCDPCEPGTASEAEKDYCSICPAGTFAAGGETWPCSKCEGNNASFVPGSAACTECGRGTSPSNGNTACSTTCLFVADDKTKFDLTGLRHADMYGPVTDSNDHKYYISVCERVSKESTPCLDQHGNHVNSLICQVSNIHVGYNTGDFLSFVPLPEPHHRDGFNLTYTHGTKCGDGKERETMISFLCDPDAGRGYPAVPHGHGNVEEDMCEYEFVWTTQYACPLCTDLDYTTTVGDCENGRQAVSYVWKSNPKLCVGGVDLPANHDQPCTMSTTSCAKGEYAKDNQVCTPAPPGTFAIGNGERVIIGGAIPVGFDNGCRGTSCEPWSVERGGILESGSQVSYLRTIRSFVLDGSVEFEYKYSGGDAATFVFRVDGEVRLGKNGTEVMLSYDRFETSVSKGLHTLEWIFTGGAPATASSRDVMVLLREIAFHNNRLAPAHPVDCPPGFYQPQSGQDDCLRCGFNTHSHLGSDECHPCPSEQYSLPGAEVCIGRDECVKGTDFVSYFTPCRDGERMEVWEPLEPYHCFRKDDVDSTHLPGNETVACSAEDCPRGQVMSQTGVCVTCPKGSYPSSGSCEPADPGTAAVPIVSYFDGFQTSSALPEGWTTGCSGLCGTRGWRAGSSFMDSGFHGDEEVDAWISLKKEFQYAGAVEFTFSVDTQEDGLDFFVDGERQDVYRPEGVGTRGKRSRNQVVNVKVAKGEHTFLWLFHQTEGFPGSVLVEKVVLFGVEGAGSEKLICPPGSYSNTRGSPECVPCSPGTMAGDSGSTSCEKCPNDEFQPHYGQSFCEACPPGALSDQEGATYCGTPCSYTDSASGLSWDLSNIGSTLIGPVQSPSFRLRQSYYLELCQPIQRASICNDTGNNAVVTYVCEVDPDTKRGVSAGNTITYGVTAEKKLEITYSGGSGVGCEGGETRTTRVVFTCNPDVNGVSGTRLVYAEGACSRTFEVSSLQGCRACATNFDGSPNSDYNMTLSECVDGFRSYIFVRTGLCMGPTSSTTTVACQTELEIPYYSVAVVGGIVLLLLAGVLVLVLRNRRIHQNYSRLLQQHDGNPLENLPSTSMIDSSTDMEHPPHDIETL